jgi:hypothetical protein
MNEYIITSITFGDMKEDMFLKFSSEDELMEHITNLSQNHNFLPTKLDFINRYLTLSTEDGTTMYLNIKRLSDDVLSNEMEHIFKIRRN